MDEFIVSARKYRPATFDSVVGQRALTTTLKNSIKNGKLAHAYLFCGPRGVGKTTCARIFAKAINCLNPKEDGEACGECESCQAFNEQRSMNIHELDAASNNSVDDIRELCKQVMIPPQIGRYKVFIIDEVHMLSASAFNAFLKTLEEPPSYVVFILATTEKHKILPTILSRCQVYDFARMTIQSTVDHLAYVAQKEGYTADPDALNLIAQKADGGMRDALSIFDQMVSFAGGNLTYESVCKNLNVLSSDYYFRLTDLFLENKVEDCLLLFNEVLQKGFDGGNFIDGLAKHLRDLLVSRDPQTIPLLEVSEQAHERYREQAKRCQPKFLFRAIKLCNDCNQAYRTSRNKRLQVEICLIQAAQLTEDDTPGAGLGPATILKPIFQQLNNSTETTLSAPAAPQAPQQKPQPTTSSAPVPPLPAQHMSLTASRSSKQQAPLPTIKLSQLGPLINMPKPVATTQETTGQVPDEKPKETLPLNEDELILSWQIFANRLPHEQTAIVQRMREMRPHKTGDSTFYVEVNNQQVAAMFQEIKPDIEKFFRSQLHNDDITMEIRLAPIQKVQANFSKPELYKRFVKEFPQLEKLTKAFDLEFE